MESLSTQLPSGHKAEEETADQYVKAPKRKISVGVQTKFLAFFEAWKDLY